MAVCKWCNQETTGPAAADSCTSTEVQFPDGIRLEASRAHFGDPGSRCHDCGIKNGGTHHPGCHVERCPRCRGQLINCGCL